MYQQFNTEFNRDMTVLYPGEYHAVKGDTILSTLLGSCVSACLYDPVNRVIGMNHFLLVSRLENPDEYYLQDSGRYALNAMELLINAMMKLGAKKVNLRAKAFGGARILSTLRDDYDDIPQSNVRFIRTFLTGENIDLVADDLGGDYGRKILFFNDTEFTVLQRRLSRRDETAAERADEEFFEKQRQRILRDRQALKKQDPLL